MKEETVLTEPLCDCPLMREILQLHSDDGSLSAGRISVLIYQELGTVIERNTINRLLEKG
jgi:hypothetical protein